jgi:putative ABC transport system ATP-binding protein
LCKSYHDGQRRRTVLDGADLQVAPGECVALLGRSGSGKSTLLNILAGIDRPDAGEVRVRGRSLTQLGEPGLTLMRRRDIGFIYQFFNLIETLTVAENLSLPLELNGLLDGLSRAQRRRRIALLLAQVGLSGREDSFPEQLSGGEQQRVTIARALAHAPALVLADEPTGNLDAEAEAQILGLLGDLFRRQGRTLVVVTHSPVVAQLAHRVLILDCGRLTDAGQVTDPVAKATA